MNKTSRLLAALLSLGLGSASAYAQSTQPPGPILNPQGLVSRAVVPAKVTPVCNAYGFAGGTGYAGQQGGGRTVYYCPQGAKAIQPLLSGAVLSSTGEADSIDIVNVKMTVEVGVPAPYDATQAYASGAQVTYNPNSAQLNPVWTAAQAVPAGNPPYNGSAYWAAGTTPARLMPITCEGSPICTIGQRPSITTAQGATSASSAVSATALTFAATPAGAAVGQVAYDRTTGVVIGAISAVSATTATVPALTTAVGSGDIISFLPFSPVAAGVVATDLTPINCPVGCYIAIRTRVSQAGVARYYTAGSQKYALGTYIETAATVTDRTGSLTSYGFPAGAVGGTLGPVAIPGIPQVERPTVCVLGDSRTAGGTDYGAGAIVLTAGGSGYVAGDVGLELSLPAGVGTGAVGDPARVIVNAVTGGAVTSIRVTYPGQYNNPANNASFAPSTAAQTLTGGTGSGLQVTAAYSNTTIEIGDISGAVGMAQRALSENGYAWTGSMIGGDAFSKYATRDYTRMAIFTASGCSSAIVELGINDVTGGRTLAQMQADAATLVSDLKGLGIKAVFLTTLPPVAASTDGYVTTANQTTNGNNSVRVAWNNWVRGTAVGALGLRGYFEVADTVESARDSGLWAPNAAPCALTCGGTHSGASGYAAEAAGIAAGLGLLQ